MLTLADLYNINYHEPVSFVFLFLIYMYIYMIVQMDIKDLLIKKQMEVHIPTV